METHNNGSFDWEKPTVQMLGRWQPWHDGHQELFKRIHAITGQVVIMVRRVPSDKEANERVPGQDDNPFNPVEVMDNIVAGLEKDSFTLGDDYIIMVVPASATLRVLFGIPPFVIRLKYSRSNGMRSSSLL